MTYIAICTEEYLNYYKELYKSIKEHSPNSKQILYYIGKFDKIINEDFDIIVGINDQFESCNQIYNTLTRICSLRARVVLDAFERGNKNVIFCGAKIKFFDRPLELENAIEHFNAVVTPHIMKPLPEDGKFPSNEQVSFTGHVSTDLVAFKNTPDIVEFLQWQDEIMKTKCETSAKTYLDQSWLNFLPFFVNDVKILRDPSYNVAYWNYKQRNLQKVHGKWVVDTHFGSKWKLTCFQFSGLNLVDPESISTHQDREVAEGDFLEFLKDYAEKVK